MPPLTVLLLVANLLSAQSQIARTSKADFRAAAAFVAAYGLPEPGLGGISNRIALPFGSHLPLVLASSAPTGVSRELVMFQIPYARYAFEYYYEGSDYDSADGPFTNHRAPDGTYLMSEQDVSDIMAQTTAGHDVVWLIATEVQTWDERRLTERWLAQNMDLEFVAHFAHIDVHRYTHPHGQ